MDEAPTYPDAAYRPARETVLGWLAEPGLADLVTRGSRFRTTAVPMVHVPGDGWGRLEGHLDRRNPQWQDHDGQAAVIVHGADGYVSPRWRPSRGDRALPTWDFQRLTATGRLVVHEDAAWLRAHLERLVARYERSAWTLERVRPGHVETLLAGIVGVELVVADVAAEAKLGQDRDPGDQARITAELRADGNTYLASEIERAARPGPVV